MSHHTSPLEMRLSILQDSVTDFGIDWDGPCPSSGNDSAVMVPETPAPISTLDLEDLMRLAPPLSESTFYGIDLYINTLDFVCRKLDFCM